MLFRDTWVISTLQAQRNGWKKIILGEAITPRLYRTSQHKSEKQQSRNNPDPLLFFLSWAFVNYQSGNFEITFSYGSTFVLREACSSSYCFTRLSMSWAISAFRAIMPQWWGSAFWQVYTLWFFRSTAPPYVEQQPVNRQHHRLVQNFLTRLADTAPAQVSPINVKTGNKSAEGVWAVIIGAIIREENPLMLLSQHHLPASSGSSVWISCSTTEGSVSYEAVDYPYCIGRPRLRWSHRVLLPETPFHTHRGHLPAWTR